MAVYSVTYDLNKQDKNYDGLIEELKNSSAYINYQKSAWLIKTYESIEALNNRLKSQIDDNDYLLVIEVKNNYLGWLPKSDWDFIRDSIFN